MEKETQFLIENKNGHIYINDNIFTIELNDFLNTEYIKENNIFYFDNIFKDTINKKEIETLEQLQSAFSNFFNIKNLKLSLDHLLNFNDILQKINPLLSLDNFDIHYGEYHEIDFIVPFDESFKYLITTQLYRYFIVNKINENEFVPFLKENNLYEIYLYLRENNFLLY